MRSARLFHQGRHLRHTAIRLLLQQSGIIDEQVAERGAVNPFGDAGVREIHIVPEMPAQEIALTGRIHHDGRIGYFQRVCCWTGFDFLAPLVDTGGAKQAQGRDGYIKSSHGAKILNLLLREKTKSQILLN